MIAFISGTGPVGKGLAMRFALAGEKVVVSLRRKCGVRNSCQGRASSGL